jgi:RNA polymerase sigma-70 factor (subfamily 1)
MSDHPDDFTLSVDLVHRAQTGDREALNRLFTRYYDRVQRIVRARLGSKLREKVDSGDILQDTFGAAVAAFDRFEMRDHASFIRWLATLAERQINAAADYHGAQKRDRRREVPLPVVDPGMSSEDMRFDPTGREPTPLDKLTRAETTALVDACVHELAEEYREIILWRKNAGADWETVAEKTGRPSAAAARMMHARALFELQKLLKHKGFVIGEGSSLDLGGGG